MSKTADNTPGSNGGALTLESLQRDVSAFKKLYPDLRSRPNLYDYLAGRDNPGLAQSRLNARVNIVLQEFHCIGRQICLWAPNCWPEFISPYLPKSEPAVLPVSRFPRLSKAFRQFRLWLERLVDNADLAIEYPFQRVQQYESAIKVKRVDPEYAYLFNSFGYGRMIICRPAAAVRIMQA